MGGCPIRSWEDRISAFTLMADLDEMDIELYRRTIAFYMNYPEDGPDNATDIEMPPSGQEPGDAGVGGTVIAGGKAGFPGDEIESAGLIEGTGAATKRPATEHPSEDPHRPKKHKGDKGTLPHIAK